MSTVRPVVDVLMCTYNGERFLPEQLDSLADQADVDIHLHVSDDGSSDQTDAVLERYRPRLKQLYRRRGPGQGATVNFLTLATDNSLKGELFAFADQDDVWEPDKLSRAAQMLAAHRDQPALYCSHSKIIDEHGNLIGHSKAHRKPPSLSNAMVQNIASGHTMVFNRKAQQLLVQAGVVDVRFHDWWLYLLVMFAGGVTVHDHQARVRYRQHASNEFGAHSSLLNQLGRAFMLMNGEYGRWVQLHQQALSGLDGQVPQERLFGLMETIRKGGVVARVRAMREGGFHRQTRNEQIALWLSVILGRL